MSFSIRDLALQRQRCRQWSPLLTQQLRVRHLHQVMAYNLNPNDGAQFYYTLHISAMCSPFYTSEKIDSTNPRWAELEPFHFPQTSSLAFVIRIWQHKENDLDKVIVTWGVYLSGLVFLGNKLSEIQPESFEDNSVIFHLRGGYFTSNVVLKTNLPKCLPFIDSLNVISTETDTYPYRCVWQKVAKAEVKSSYSVDKLQKLQYLQFAIKHRSFNVDKLKEKIVELCGCSELTLKDLEEAEPKKDESSQHTSHLLTMTALNKMLHRETKLTKHQRLQITSIKKKIEIAKFRRKLLLQEKDKKIAHIRQMTQKLGDLSDKNEQTTSILMEDYRQLSRESQYLAEWSAEVIQLKELFLHSSHQLNHRRRQLMNELLFIYPIKQIAENKFTIHKVYLPDSDALSNAIDSDLSVALGYVCHVLKMCSFFLQVPLRYPITYFGSMSYITDHITTTLSEKDKDFPLFTKGKDRMHFLYGVYLINKNIAQLKWLCGQTTPDLRATLPNLLSLLQSRHFTSRKDLSENKQTSSEPIVVSKSINIIRKANRGSFTDRHFLQRNTVSPSISRNDSPSRKLKFSEKCKDIRPGLSDILVIPEAYMNQQISENTLKGYISNEWLKKNRSDNGCANSIHETTTKNSSPFVARNESIEEGTDIVHSVFNLSEEMSQFKLDNTDGRKSRSVDSLLHETTENVEVFGSEPHLNVKSNMDKEEFVQQWVESGNSSSTTEEIFWGESSKSTETRSPLTERTDALLHTTSFNLIKPK